jgi:hypothetical protein
MGVDFVMMVLASIVAAVAAVPPNILVLLTDDQGEGLIQRHFCHILCIASL